MKNVRTFFQTILILLLLVGCAPKEKEASPELAAARYQLGVAYFDAGNYRAALPELSKAAELAPSNAEYRNALGMALLFTRKLDPAIKVFEEAIAIEPKFSEAKNNLASAYIMKGELERAKPLLAQVLDDPLYPTPQFAYFNLARIYERQGKIDEAIEEYKLALDIRPDYVDAHYNLGLLYLQQGRTDLAIEEFTEATRLNPKIAVYQQSLGVAYVRAGRYQEARRAFERVLEVEKRGVSAEYARKMLQELPQ
ncbi:MAG: tetratricopeptide repeat protein [Candidatus Methylomirabilales bacterium]